MARGRERALKKWGDPDGPLPTLGPLVVDWCEEYLPHAQGDIQDEPLKLHEDQQALIWRAYEIHRPGHDKEGEKLHSEVIFMGPKGIAKSEAAGAIVACEAFGPVRFDGWDAYGDPVGAPVRSVRIPVISTEESQAGNTYIPFAYMVGEDTCTEQFRRDYGPIDTGRHEESSTRTVLPNHRGKVFPATSGASSKEGRQATMIVFEEGHQWLLPELLRTHATIRRALVKRADAWALHVTNAPEPGAGSMLESVLKDVGLDGTILVARQPPEGAIPDDVAVRDLPEPVLRKWLKYVYGSAWPFQRQDAIVQEARRYSTPDSDARRLYLNLSARGEKRWVDEKLWAARKSPERLADGDCIALGFDGSRKRDATVLMACRPRDSLLEPLAWWEKPEGPTGQGWEVRNDVVKAAFREAFRRFRVVKVYADPPHWRDEIDDLAGEFGKKVVLEFDTNSKTRMAPALEAFEEAIPTGQLIHTGDANLTRHILNAEAVKAPQPGPDGRRPTVRLEKPDGVDDDSMRARIDGAVAAVLARAAAMDALSEGLVEEDGPVFAY